MNRIFKKQSILSLVLALVLIAAMALSLVACDKTGEEHIEFLDTSVSDTGSSAESTSETTSPAQTTEGEDDSVVGEGNTSFAFSVTFADGSSKSYTVKTNKTIVGEALLDAGLIAGENGQYGLYVKTVDGVTLDYAKDGKYWAFYIDDAYASTGVDLTEITEGKTYSFRAE